MKQEKSIEINNFPSLPDITTDTPEEYKDHLAAFFDHLPTFILECNALADKLLKKKTT